MCQRQGHRAQKAADCRAERHQRSAVASELRNKCPYFHCPPWGPLMAVQQLEWTVAISGIHHSSPGCALHIKRKGGYERRIYKEEISVVCVVSLANTQFVLKLDNTASPKCYFVLIQSMGIQAALAFTANSASQMQGLHYQLL